MRFAENALHICLAELRAEWRNRQVVTTMVLLGALCVVTFGFAGRAGSSRLAPAALWVSLVLAASAGLAQTIARHQASEVTKALRTGGASSGAIYLARLVVFGLLLGTTAALCWLLTALLIGAPAPPDGLALARLAGCTLGLAAVATTLSELLMRRTAHGARLAALLLLPLALPVVWLVARPQAVAAVVGAHPGRQLALLVAVDLLILGAGLGLTRRT